jgi:hypothetical protein
MIRQSTTGETLCPITSAMHARSGGTGGAGVTRAWRARLKLREGLT